MAASSLPPSKPLFPRLKGGPHRMPPEQVAQHQKARLELAMVEAVARHGFEGTTIKELVGLAGVSKSTFYQHFEGKEDCFLATFDEVIRQVTEQVSAAYRQPGDFRERLLAALATFMDLAKEEPGAARLAAVDSLTLGSAGVAHRERGTQAFEAMIRQSFDHSPSPVEVSDTVVRAIVAGVRGSVYRRLRAGRADELPGLTETLVDWALSYQRPPSAALQRTMEVARRPLPPRDAAAAGEGEKGIPWEESPASPRSRRELGQRERMIRAAAQVVVKEGYAALSIPAISATAGVSNATFYEHFEDTRDALLAAFDEIATGVLSFVGAAFAAEGSRPEAIGAGARALTEYFAAHELFARLSFFELPAAGPIALDQADRVLDSFGAFLRPGTIPPAFAGSVPEELMIAIPSGIWATIQHEIVSVGHRSLPDLAPEIVRVAASPFDVA